MEYYHSGPQYVNRIYALRRELSLHRTTGPLECYAFTGVFCMDYGLATSQDGSLKPN